MTWTVGDVSGSDTLTVDDHLYANHVNELRIAAQSRQATITVGLSGHKADYICSSNTNDQSTTTQTIINNALTALSGLGGGTLHLRAGTYYIKTPGISIPDNCTLQGEGFSTVLYRSNGHAFPGTIHNPQHGASDTGQNSNIIIRNLMINGNSANSSNPGGAQDNIELNGCTNSLIENVYIYDSPDSAIVLGLNAAYETTNTTVRSCFIDTTYDIGIYMSDPDNCIVTNNHIRNTNSYGIRVIRRNSGTTMFNNLANNRIYNCGQANVVSGIMVDNGDLTNIVGNVVVLAGNNGIEVNGAAYVNISGNFVAQPDKHGIFFTAGAGRSAVTGNNVYQASRTTGNTYSGIAINSCQDISVTGNRSGDNGTGTRQKYGFEEQGTADHNLVVGNMFDRNGTGGVLVLGASTINANNRT
jgi:parallel beta-helix repeat protein